MTHDWITRGREVLGIEIDALASLRERLGPSFAEAVERLAACRGRIAITGIGKSGLIGRKIAATLSSTGMHDILGKGAVKFAPGAGR